MSFIDTCTEMLISAIKNGSVYKQYCTALKAVNKIPGLKEQVHACYRRFNLVYPETVVIQEFLPLFGKGSLHPGLL